MLAYVIFGKIIDFVGLIMNNGAETQNSKNKKILTLYLNIDISPSVSFNPNPSTLFAGELVHPIMELRSSRGSHK